MTATKTKAKPDAVEVLRQLVAREAWSGRDAAFAAAIIEIADRVDTLAQLDVASSMKVEALEEFSFDLSGKVQQLLALFILTGRGERASADALEKIM
jgi:hypothetical protein